MNYKGQLNLTGRLIFVRSWASYDFKTSFGVIMTSPAAILKSALHHITWTQVRFKWKMLEPSLS